MNLYSSIVQRFLSDDSKEPQLIDLTYLWRVENYSKIPDSEPKRSLPFIVAKDSYTLELTKGEQLTVLLRQVKASDPATKFLCTVSLVDRHGKTRHLVRKEAEMGKCAETKELLKIPSVDLSKDKSDVVPMDILSIRLGVTLSTDDSLLSPHDSESNLQTLSCDLRKLYEDKTDCDVVLKVANTEYKAHRLVLSSRSPTFAQMFRQNKKEPLKAIIDIKDVEASVFGTVLHYIYTGKVHGLTPDTASRLIDAADEYQLQELKRTCVRFLTANITMKNICDALLVAEKLREEVLNNAALAFISKNATDLIFSELWKDFKNQHPAVANAALGNVILSIQK